MKKLLLILLCLPLLFTSCNSEKENLERKIQNLQKDNNSLRIDADNIRATYDELTYENIELNKRLFEISQQCRSHEIVDSMRTVERMTKWGYVRIMGTDKIIDFLYDNYCTHFKYAVDNDEVERTLENPILIKN